MIISNGLYLFCCDSMFVITKGLMAWKENVRGSGDFKDTFKQLVMETFEF